MPNDIKALMFVRGDDNQAHPVRAFNDNLMGVVLVGADGTPIGVTDAALGVMLIGDGGVPLAVDRVTDALESITTDHAAIHERMGYSAYITFANVADAATRNIVMTTSADFYVHLKFYDIWISNASGTWQMYENPQSVVGGTPVTPVNRNRVGTPPTRCACREKLKWGS